MDDLKPCPWCGMVPIVTRVTLPAISPGYSKCYHIDCKNDECPENPGTWYYYVYSDAVEEWNEIVSKSGESE